MALWSKLDTNAGKPKYLDRGQIVAVVVTDGGTGYVSAPAVTISAPASGTQATATATVVDGVVTAITITDPGAGYVASDNVSVSFDSGAATAEAVFHGAAYDDGHIFFVDREESQQSENRAKGFRSPGWWLYRTYTDAQSNVRHKSELLVAMDVVAATSGDAADDATVVDRTITITTQPADQSVTEPGTATFTVVATVSPSTTITYQWQKAESDAPTTWSNIGGATNSSYTTGATAVAPGAGDTDGDLYRVVVSADGATSVTSSAATLTVTA